MKEIERVKLTNACDIIMGQSPESSTYNQEGKGLPFFQGKADFGVLHPSIRYYCSDPKKIAQADDILLSVRAPIGALNIATEESCIGRGLAALRVKCSTDTMYLYYLLQSLNGVLNARGTGSTFKAINKQDLDEIYIPLPDILTQKSIAATLDAVSEVLRLRKAQLAELDNLVKSQFRMLFSECADKTSVPKYIPYPNTAYMVPEHFQKTKDVPYYSVYAHFGLFNMQYFGEKIGWQPLSYSPWDDIVAARQEVRFAIQFAPVDAKQQIALLEQTWLVDAKTALDSYMEQCGSKKAYPYYW